MTWEEMRQWLGYLPRAAPPPAEAAPDPEELKRRMEIVYMLHQASEG
jgi:hypothetical protein